MSIRRCPSDLKLFCRGKYRPRRNIPLYAKIAALFLVWLILEPFLSMKNAPESEALSLILPTAKKRIEKCGKVRKNCKVSSRRSPLASLFCKIASFVQLTKKCVRLPGLTHQSFSITLPATCTRAMRSSLVSALHCMAGPGSRGQVIQKPGSGIKTDHGEMLPCPLPFLISRIAAWVQL